MSVVEFEAVRSIETDADDNSKILLRFVGVDQRLYSLKISRAVVSALGAGLVAHGKPPVDPEATDPPDYKLSPMEVEKVVPLVAHDHSPPVLALRLATGAWLGLLLSPQALQGAKDGIAQLEAQHNLRDPKAPVH